MADIGFGSQQRSLVAKLMDLNLILLLLICTIACVGFAMLYSVADGNWDPWASRQMVRFGLGFLALIVVAMIDIRVWLNLAYPAYVVSLVLLVWVEVAGDIGMGAQRWISLGPLNLQPSELMKIALVLALSRYFHGISTEDVSKPLRLIPPLMMIAIPVALVVRQPDLGTAILLLAGGGALVFLAGINWWYIISGAVAAIAAIPIGWQFLQDYQRNRVLTFLDPERDPLGAGYHILQSKIALGSGGVFGQGFLQGTQSHLNFLPEKQTDFIFTMLAEEFGLVGALGLLGLYVAVLGIGVATAIRCRSQFGRLMAMGVCVTLFLYVFINAAMVMGLVPVVGVPMPLVSYGGTSMMTIMFGFGLLMSVHIHRDTEVPRHTTSLW